MALVADRKRMTGITGQSLSILEDLYFACVDDACSLSHFLPRSTSSNQLGVNCDIVITPRNASLVKTIRLSARDAVGSRCTVSRLDWACHSVGPAGKNAAP